MNADDVKKASVDEVFKQFSSSKSGLSSQDARERLDTNGPNEIVKKKVNPLVKFLGYFWGPIPWMIEIAAILSAVIHRWEDFSIIMVMLLINAGVGYWQEHKAANEIESLKKKMALKARVRRDGRCRPTPP